MAKTSNTLSLETGMLAFARSLQITEGLFYATRKADTAIVVPIEILEKGVRGQSSEDKAKNPGLSNPQSVEYAIVPQGHDGVRLTFSIRFMPFSLTPHACNNTDVGTAYARLAAEYRRAGGYKILAKLFLWNIANARFAWRNRFQSDVMSVNIKTSDGISLKFDPLKLSLSDPESFTESALIEGDSAAVEKVVDGIASGLSNEDHKAYTVHVSWDADMEAGQEVFPSQEYVREEKADANLSRVFAKLPTIWGGRPLMQASMHSQKIGAALRYIDIWYGDEEPISVNPYGGVQETSAVLRNPKTKCSFYDLRKDARALIEGVENAKTASEISGAAHFVMANLIRGGVFGSSSKKAEANS
ncbi:type I-F CRISPR-associated protein Csy3 [Acetobacter thailandicus]|uniref:type I-F CRISPR-associated protein Csy3 n=1 Tax=Acetobacter thailandicus TaxID=1502842 RepID=UPI001BA57EB8|nr:type I-F CRISPR-associated protein Csy3 [Acetobacter thailandicus]MBS0981357.1 type I-F CRISPR-associated protein Csy3 [Acetobacter thailandicus]